MYSFGKQPPVEGPLKLHDLRWDSAGDVVQSGSAVEIRTWRSDDMICARNEKLRVLEDVV